MDMSAAARRRRRRRVADENRKRAPRACTRCKARKSRCIEIERGACQRCRLKSLPCVFEREMSPNVPDAAVLSSTASPAVSRTTAERPEQDEDVSHVTDQPTQFSPLVASTGVVAETSPAESFSGDGHPSERFMWPRFLSKLRETFSLDSCGTSTATANQTARPPPALSPTDLQRLRKAADAFPPRPVADFLLSVCIEHGTDSFYYFDQVRFLAEIDQFYTDPNSRLRYDISFICLAYAAFALGSQWTALARPDGRKPPPILQEDNDPGRIFYYQARALVPDVIDLPCLRAVQATFVLGVYLLPASSIGSAYLYLGLSLRKALAMDLHLNADEVGIMDDEEKEVRRRIWWAVYSLERSTTIKLNRPRTVNPAIITVSLPQANPALDDNQKFNNIEHQIADARLMLILDRVSEPSEWTDAQTAPGRFGDELKQWKRSLPASLKLVNVHPKASAFRATFHLYLNYYFAWIAMGKVSVVSVVRARLRHAFASTSSPPSSVGYTPQQTQMQVQQQRSSSTRSTPPHVEEHTDNMSRSCIKAARKMLSLFEELSRTGNLTRFSFTDFQGCSIATIVILLAGIVEHDDPSFERLADFGLTCLRRMAEGGNSAAKTGVGFVEALRSITEEAREKLKKISSLAALGLNYQSSEVRSSTDTGAGGAAAAAGGGDMSQVFLQERQTSALSQEHYNGWLEWASRQPAHQYSTVQQIMPPFNSGLPLFPPSSQQQQQHVQHLSGDSQLSLGPPPGLSSSGGSVMGSLVGGSGSSNDAAAAAAVAMSANGGSPWQSGGGEMLPHDTHDRGTNHGQSPHELRRRFSRWDGAAALQQLSVPVGSSLGPPGGGGGGGGGGAGGGEAAPVPLAPFAASGGSAMQQHQQQHSHHQPLTLQRQQQQQQQQQQYQQALHGQQIMQGNGMPGNGGGNMFSTLYTDEQAYLISLTGWNVLGVSELYEP